MVRFFIVMILAIFTVYAGKGRGEDLSVGFIYKKDIPEEAFYLFDWLVVEPDNFSPEYLKERFYIKNKKSKLIAYVSLGEVEKSRTYYNKLKREWILGENRGWNSKIVDLRAKEYVDFIFENVFQKLKEYDGFFLDTLDSYQLVLKSEEDKKMYEKAIVDVIKKLKKMYPNKIIITNRGFEIVDDVNEDIEALVAESLFYGLEVGKEIKYKKMKEEDTKWLLDKLNYVKSKGIKVIVIDYVEPKNRKLQKEVARKIYQLGFIPYVTDRFLNTIGTGIYQLKPRKVLLIYDASEQSDPAYSVIHRLIQPWIEYFGYVPVLRELNQVLEGGKFDMDMVDEYRAVFIRASSVKNPSRLFKWLTDRKNEGMKIFFVGYLPFPIEESYLKQFNIRKVGQLNLLDKYEITRSTFKFFESEPRLESVPMLQVDNPIHYIEVKSNSKLFHPLAITDWGGYALDGTLLIFSGKETLFGVHPIDFFNELIAPDFPVPDITTENGRRILTAHVDGDAGFGVADFGTSKNLMEIIRDEIIKRYQIPHTVSIIEGEIAPYGLYPDKSEKLEEIAKSIFQLENVEPASHSFSHPYRWQKLENPKLPEEATETYNLNIKGYKFDLEREISGSVEYINRKLLTTGERVKMFLWTGDCVPSTNALRIAYRNGLYNVNGGYTWISKKEPFFSYISPMGLDRDGYFQIYPPVQNENIYTNLWRDYYGYIRVIETFEMTERPYRLKSISIYYHFYSAQKIASLKALKEVYEYALSQRVNPMFLHEYAQRVLEFRNTAIGEDIRDGTTIVRSGGNLKTLRVSRDIGYPDVFKSTGVVGFEDHNGYRYIHLDNSGSYKLILGNTKSCFYLKDSNGQIIESKKSKMLALKIKSTIPLDYSFYCDNCLFNLSPKPEHLEKQEKNIKVRYNSGKESYVEAYCKE